MPIVTRLRDKDRSILSPRAVVESRPTHLGHDLRAGHEVDADLGLDLGGRGVGDVEVLGMRHPQTSRRVYCLRFWRDVC